MQGYRIQDQHTNTKFIAVNNWKLNSKKQYPLKYSKKREMYKY